MTEIECGKILAGKKLRNKNFQSYGRSFLTHFQLRSVAVKQDMEGNGEGLQDEDQNTATVLKLPILAQANVIICTQFPASDT